MPPSKHYPPPPLLIAPDPVTPYELADALLTVLRSASALGLFTSLTNPVWDGWAGWRMLAWRLPPALSIRPYAEPEDGEYPECYWQVAGLLMEMEGEGLVEKRINLPLARSTDLVARGVQEWQFRIPGYDGYCYWEPARPMLSKDTSPWPLACVTQENWTEKVATADFRPLAERFGTGPVPPFILAQIERRWIAKMNRAAGQGRRGRPNLR